jgi:hypothetical protein
MVTIYIDAGPCVVSRRLSTRLRSRKRPSRYRARPGTAPGRAVGWRFPPHLNPRRSSRLDVIQPLPGQLVIPDDPDPLLEQSLLTVQTQQLVEQALKFVLELVISRVIVRPVFGEQDLGDAGVIRNGAQSVHDARRRIRSSNATAGNRPPPEDGTAGRSSNRRIRLSIAWNARCRSSLIGASVRISSSRARNASGQHAGQPDSTGLRRRHHQLQSQAVISFSKLAHRDRNRRAADEVVHHYVAHTITG